MEDHRSQSSLTLNKQTISLLNQLRAHPQITKLTIENYWPEEELYHLRDYFPNLQFLELKNLEDVDVINLSYPDLQYVIIEDCNELCELVYQQGYGQNIQSLKLINCKRLEPISLTNIPNLIYLYIDNCETLQRITLERLENLENLTLINLRDPYIQPSLAHNVSRLLQHNRLMYLNIENCNIRTNDLRFLQNNTSLDTLILIKIGLTSLDGIQNTNIEYLDVSDNQINRIRFENNSVRLFRLDNNNITDISNIFNGYSKLKKLYLPHNKIQTIRNLPSTLETLSMRDNPVETIKQVGNLTNIETVNIDQNKHLTFDVQENQQFANVLIQKGIKFKAPEQQTDNRHSYARNKYSRF